LKKKANKILHKNIQNFHLTKRFGNKGLFGFNVISCGTSPFVTNGSSFDGRGD
jgi:hypothetical protein